MTMQKIAFLLLPCVALSATKYALHMTDQHYDSRYKEGAQAHCLEDEVIGGIGCCRADSIGIPPERKAGYYGDYSCDSSYQLIQDSLIWLANWISTDPIGQKVNFLVWTGDDPGHDDVTQTPQSNLDAIITLTNLFKKYLPTLRVFPALGNHDAYPCDELDPNLADWLLIPCAGNWSTWLPDADAQATIQKGGYYTTLVAPGLRIIALETTWYDDRNHFIVNKTDVAGQDSWLNKTLATARTNKEQVWIIGHIYPGGTRNQDSVNYQAITDSYQDIIKGHIYGHSHKDGFTLLHPNHASGTPPVNTTTGVVYIAPSLMPDDQDPAFRVYEYDDVTFTITNIYQYHAALNVINTAKKMDFNLTYTAKDAYSLSDLSSSSWWSLLDRMDNDDALFQKYMSYHYQGTYTNGSCSGSCKSSTICGLRYALDQDRSSC